MGRVSDSKAWSLMGKEEFHGEVEFNGEAEFLGQAGVCRAGRSLKDGGATTDWQHDSPRV